MTGLVGLVLEFDDTYIYLVACICDTICFFLFIEPTSVHVGRDDDMTFMIYAIILLIYFIIHPPFIHLQNIIGSLIYPLHHGGQSS